MTGPAITVRRIRADEPAASDYTSTFAAGPAGDRDARTWAVAVLGGAPAAFRLLMRVGWRLGLRLRLDGEHALLGWPTVPVGHAEHTDVLRMQADGPLLRAANTVRVDAGELLWTSTCDFHGLPGRALWAFVAPVHHRTLPWLIRRAARRSADHS